MRLYRLGCFCNGLSVLAALQLHIYLTPKFHSLKLISFNLFIVRSKMSWADQPRSFSDCIAILNAYKVKFVLEDIIVDTYSRYFLTFTCIHNGVHNNVSSYMIFLPIKMDFSPL